MRRLFASLFTLAFLTASPAFAVMEDYPSVKLQGLDKSVGRTVTFEATVGSTIQYGPLFIKIHACRKAPPIEKPESAAFLQIWEVPPGEQKSEWVFSGWMFASSPALSAMDHPVYDVWVLDCTGREEPNEEAASAQTDQEAADQTTLGPADPAAEGAASSTPDEETAIPTDSEAEPEPAQETPAVQPEADTPDPFMNPELQGNPTPAEAETGSVSDEPYPAVDPATLSSDPDVQQGVTAYDFMGQQPQKPQPQAIPSQSQQPIY